MPYKIGSFAIYNESANTEGTLIPNGVKYGHDTYDSTTCWHIAKIISIEKDKISIQYIESSGWKRSKHKSSRFSFFAIYPQPDFRIVRKEAIKPLEFFNKKLLISFCDETDRIEIKDTPTKRELISLITKTAKAAFAEVKTLNDVSRLKEGQVVIRNHSLPCVVDELKSRINILYHKELGHPCRGEKMASNYFSVGELRALKDISKEALVQAYRSYIGPIDDNCTKASIIHKINKFYRAEYKKVIQLTYSSYGLLWKCFSDS